MIIIQQIPTWIRNIVTLPPKVDTDTQGSTYDLLEIYDDINEEYFRSRLSLNITWFGCKYRIARTSRTLGLYDRRDKLVKIHRLLDDRRFPDYFVSFIVYHEMLHHVCPPKRGKNGRRDIHHREFKKREKEYEHYHRALKWEKENLSTILNLEGTHHGRS